MAYDLYGKAPTSPEGEQFRRAVGRWSPLVEVCYEMAPWQTRRCRDRYDQEGTRGLSKKNAIKLALRLKYQLLMGRVRPFMDRFSGEASGYRTDECVHPHPA